MSYHSRIFMIFKPIKDDGFFFIRVVSPRIKILQHVLITIVDWRTAWTVRRVIGSWRTKEECRRTWRNNRRKWWRSDESRRKTRRWRTNWETRWTNPPTSNWGVRGNVHERHTNAKKTSMTSLVINRALEKVTDLVDQPVSPDSEC